MDSNETTSGFSAVPLDIPVRAQPAATEKKMTPEEADSAQQWAGMDGSIAWHLIDRHAEDWNEIGEMMNAWLRAAVLAEREACAAECERMMMYPGGRQESSAHNNVWAAAKAIRERSNAK